jgi:protein TonB
MNNILGAFLSTLLGGLLMVQLVVTLNCPVDKKEEFVKEKTRIVRTKKAEKKAIKKSEPEPRPRARTKASPKAPPPNLGSMIGNLAMNIPEFAAPGIERDSQELLDDIAEDAIMSEGTVDSKPQATRRAPIEYPSSAAKSGVQGYVIVNLLIAKDGSIQLAKVLESTPEGVFDNTVLNGIRSWSFTPARYKGEPVAVWVKQKIRFNI